MSVKGRFWVQLRRWIGPVAVGLALLAGASDGAAADSSLLARMRLAEDDAQVTGARIDKGGNVGGVGSTGRSTGPHVHYEIWHDNVVKNPNNFIEAGRNVL